MPVKLRTMFFMAGFIERKIGKHIGIILTVENLLDYRQSENELLFREALPIPHFSIMGTN